MQIIRGVNLLFAILLGSTSFAQAPDWIWGRIIEGAMTDRFTDVETDSDDGVYASGIINSDTAWFDGIQVIKPASVDTLSFLVKYDLNGNAVWVRTMQGLPLGLHRSTNGGVSGTVVFTWAYGLPDTTFYSPGTWSYLSVTINSTGDLDDPVFHEELLPLANTMGAPIALEDTTMGLIIGGTYSDTITIGGELLGAEGAGLFLARYDHLGEPVWATKILDEVTGAFVDPEFTDGVSAADSGVFMSGIFYGDALIGETEVWASPYGSGYIASVSQNGDLLQSLVDLMPVTSLELRDDGDIVFTYYGGPTDDVYFGVVEVGSDLQTHWSVGHGGFSNAYIGSLSLDENGSATVCGTAIAGSVQGCGAPVYSGSPDVFVMRVDDLGVCEWYVRSAYWNTWGGTISLESLSSYYVIGGYDGSAAFGPDTLAYPGPYPGHFLAKIGSVELGVPERMEGIGAWPNPTENALQISGTFDSDLAVRVVDLGGRSVTDHISRLSPSSFDVSRLAPGTYVLSTGEQHIRFVKE